RLEALLSDVPETLRNGAALVAAIAAKGNMLARRVAARDEAARAASTAREAALSAQKDFQAAEIMLAACKERHENARQVFQGRLEQAGLTEQAFGALKPAIESIERDHETVNEHRRKLANALDEAQKTQAAIAGEAQP